MQTEKLLMQEKLFPVLNFQKAWNYQKRSLHCYPTTVYLNGPFDGYSITRR